MRAFRFGRLYKLIKLTRLIRILKIMKERSKLLKYLHEFLKIGIGFERLLFFFLIFMILTHIGACLWLIIASLYDETYTGTWMESYINEGNSNSDLYAIAFYWTITTITTVGYGDISGNNNLEKVFCSLIMVIGVFAFSFANGSLASIIQNYDQTNANYQEKVEILNKI